MHKDPITIEEIEDYLSGQLSPEALAEFETRLLEDDEARKSVMQLRKVIEGVQGYAFKQKLKDYHRNLFPRDEKPE